MALRQGSHATWPGGGRGGRSCRRCSRLLARAVVPPGGRRGAARQVPRRRGSLPGTGSPVTGRLARSPARSAGMGLPAAGAERLRPLPGAQDGQRKWQTVYPGSRTFAPSMSPANPLANTYSCRHRSPISVADLLDRAVINLPVDSQTCISAKLLKQSWMAGRTCVTYVNSLSVVRGNVSVQHPVPGPPGPCPPATACPAQRGRATR
jgi:hypothetical protein